MGGSGVQGTGMSEEKEKKSIWLNDWLVLLALVAMCVSAPILLLVQKSGWALLGILDTKEPLPKEAIRGVSLLFTALIGGIAAIIFGTWRAMIASAQTKVARDQYERSLDRDYADLFTKAVEQLGTDKIIKRPAKDSEGKPIFDENGRALMNEVTKPNIEVRLGAIYALERISQDSERDHIAVMETLCAYVRENAPAERCEALPITDVQNDPIREWVRAFPDVRSDVQAVLKILGRRSKARIGYEIEETADKSRYVLDLRKTNLRNAELRAGDFRNALLSGAHLEGADLGRAHLEDANLDGAHLEGADLNGAHLERANLDGAHLEGADLRRAELEGANLIEAHLEGANLSEAHLERAYLREAHLEGANLNGAHLKGANLIWAHLEGADLNGAHLVAYLHGAHFEGANLNWAHLEGASLSLAHLEGANLSEAHLERACLSWAHFEGANLSQAHLEGAFLYGAHLERADLMWAHLEGADLRQAHLEGADLIEADLKSANLAMVRIDCAMASFADFTAAEDLSQQAVESCFGCAGTELPEGLDRPAHWHPERLEDVLTQYKAYDAWKAARAAGEKPPWVDEADWSGWSAGSR